MFAGMPFPSLKGKGAEVRHLAGALASAFEAFMDRSNQQHRQTMLGLQLVCQIERTLDDYAEDYKWPAHISLDFEKCCTTFCQLSTALSHHFHQQGVPLFNYTIKYHYLEHIGLMSHNLNPRLGWCYSGEDFMKVVKRVVQASHSGGAPHVAARKAINKYAIGLGVALALK